jgi:hypothetical protein
MYIKEIMPLIIASIIRHLLTLAAGGLLTIGVSEADAHSLASAAEPVVGGALLYGASQAWSLVDKKKKKS